MKRLLFKRASQIVSGALVLVLAANSIGAAQMRRRPRPPEERQKMQERLAMLRELKLIEVLELSEEQSTQFLPLFKAYQKKRGLLAAKRDVVLQELGILLEEEGTSDQKLQEKIDRLGELRREQGQLDAEFFAKGRTILTPRQVARMAVFEVRFERAILEQLRDRSADQP